MTACLASSNGARVPSQNDSTHASGPTGLGHQGVWRSVRGSRHLLFRQHPLTGRASANPVAHVPVRYSQHRCKLPAVQRKSVVSGCFSRHRMKPSGPSDSYEPNERIISPNSCRRTAMPNCSWGGTERRSGSQIHAPQDTASPSWLSPEASEATMPKQSAAY